MCIRDRGGGGAMQSTLGAAAPAAPATPAAPAVHAPPVGAGARTSLAMDGCVDVLMAQRLLADAVSLELTFASKTHSSLRNLTINVEPPAQLRVALSCAAVGADARGHRLTVPLLHGGQAVVVIARFDCADVPTPQMRVPAFVSYMEVSTRLARSGCGEGQRARGVRLALWRRGMVASPRALRDVTAAHSLSTAARAAPPRVPCVRRTSWAR